LVAADDELNPSKAFDLARSDASTAPPQGFTRTAETSMKALGVSRATIRRAIDTADSVVARVSKKPGERVVAVTKLDLHIIYNATTRVVIQVDHNRAYRPNDPMQIERGHPEDRSRLRDLFLGLDVELSGLEGDERTATIQRLRNRARAGKWYPPFEIVSRTSGAWTWLGRRDAPS
jgi:hypothetical protein